MADNSIEDIDIHQSLASFPSPTMVIVAHRQRAKIYLASGKHLRRLCSIGTPKRTLADPHVFADHCRAEPLFSSIAKLEPLTNARTRHMLRHLQRWLPRLFIEHGSLAAVVIAPRAMLSVIRRVAERSLDVAKYSPAGHHKSQDRQARPSIYHLSQWKLINPEFIYS